MHVPRSGWDGEKGKAEAHLSVHEAGDGCSQPHLQHLEPVHVLLLKQRLQAGGEEHQHRQDVALPARGLGVANKFQKKACGRGKEKAQLVRESTRGSHLCPGPPRSGGTDGAADFFFF